MLFANSFAVYFFVRCWTTYRKTFNLDDFSKFDRSWLFFRLRVQKHPKNHPLKEFIFENPHIWIMRQYRNVLLKMCRWYQSSFVIKSRFPIFCSWKRMKFCLVTPLFFRWPQFSLYLNRYALFWSAPPPRDFFLFAVWVAQLPRNIQASPPQQGGGWGRIAGGTAQLAEYDIHLAGVILIIRRDWRTCPPSEDGHRWFLRQHRSWPPVLPAQKNSFLRRV